MHFNCTTEYLSPLSDIEYQHLSMFPLFTEGCTESQSVITHQVPAFVNVPFIYRSMHFHCTTESQSLSDIKYQHLSMFPLFTEACTESQSVIRHQVPAFISVPFIYRSMHFHCTTESQSPLNISVCYQTSSTSIYQCSRYLLKHAFSLYH